MSWQAYIKYRKLSNHHMEIDEKKDYGRELLPVLTYASKSWIQTNDSTTNATQYNKY